ncbi:MAG: lysophospholipid acyltransferase family protein [Candidatus Heteroscillospira sp.]|jgi:1-acyl-sn-glycerol-3-phosphate acyltransferase
MNKFYRFIVALLSPLVKLVYPYRLTVHGELPRGAAVVCANHSSYIDPVLVAVIFGKNNYLRFMGKVELFRIPLLGAFLRKLGAFPVDREGGDIEALRTSIDVLKSGSKLMLFPEGTRVSDDDAVAAKTGAVRLASRHKVPIVPVFISRDKRIFRKFDVCVGESYNLDKLPRSEYPAAAEELMDKIAAMNPEKK